MAKKGEYCRKWEEEELRFTRQTVLSSVGINLEDFDSTYPMYSNRELLGKKEVLVLTEYQLKIIKKARKIKRLKYDEKYLSTTLRTG